MFSFINRIRDYLSVRLRESQTSGTILLALVIGMSAGLTAVVLRIAIESVQWPFQVQLGGWLSKWLGCALGAIVVLVKMIISAITKGSVALQVVKLDCTYRFAIGSNGNGSFFISLAVAFGARRYCSHFNALWRRHFFYWRLLCLVVPH